MVKYGYETSIRMRGEVHDLLVRETLDDIARQSGRPGFLAVHGSTDEHDPDARPFLLPQSAVAFATPNPHPRPELPDDAGGLEGDELKRHDIIAWLEGGAFAAYSRGEAGSRYRGWAWHWLEGRDCKQPFYYRVRTDAGLEVRREPVDLRDLDAWVKPCDVHAAKPLIIVGVGGVIVLAEPGIRDGLEGEAPGILNGFDRYNVDVAERFSDISPVALIVPED